MKTLSGQGNNVTYAYNGLGDRLRETVNGNPTTFTMDLNTGLTQALSDGTKAYIYGNGRIAQAAGTSTEYFLRDALSSVRQMTNAGSTLTYAKAYDPYGVVTSTLGSSQSSYGYTGEYTSNNLVYLRARMYAPNTGRFLTRDSWMGYHNRPLSLNRWNYVEANPVNYTDPSGYCIAISSDPNDPCVITLVQIEPVFPLTHPPATISIRLPSPLCKVLLQGGLNEDGDDDPPEDEGGVWDNELYCKNLKYDYEGLLVQQVLVLGALNRTIDTMYDAQRARNRNAWAIAFAEYLQKMTRLAQLEAAMQDLIDSAVSADCDVKDWPPPFTPLDPQAPPAPPPAGDETLPQPNPQQSPFPAGVNTG